MKSPARYIADFVVQGNNILDASVTLADLGPDVLANLASAGANIAGLTTSNIAEGSNLYYTDARVYANINPLLANLDIGANLTTSNTDALAEGTTNLYFSNDRVYANVAPLLEGIVAENVDLTAVYANINNLSNSINALFAFNDQVDIDGGVFEGDIDGGEWQYDPNAVDLDAGTY